MFDPPLIDRKIPSLLVLENLETEDGINKPLEIEELMHWHEDSIVRLLACHGWRNELLRCDWDIFHCVLTHQVLRPGHLGDAP